MRKLNGVLRAMETNSGVKAVREAGELGKERVYRVYGTNFSAARLLCRSEEADEKERRLD